MIRAEYIDHMGDDARVTDAARTKTQRRIVEAFERGYRVTEEGKLLGPKGELSVRLRGSQRYPTFSTNWGGSVYGVPVHQFAAYCFFGKDAFASGIVVRHLDGNSLNLRKKNLALGSYSDNEFDKSALVRTSSAKKARASQGIVPRNAKLSRDDVLFIRSEYEKLKGRKAPNGFTKALCEKYNVCQSVINKVVTGEYYASYVD